MTPSPHPDAPERTPVVQGIWCYRFCMWYSFSEFLHSDRTDTLVPFGWFLVPDPERGAVYTNHRPDAPRLGPREVLEYARAGRDGWKLAGGGA